jgi:hypothetical protein
MLAALLVLSSTTASAQDEPLAVYPPLAPCDGEVFSFWFEGDSYVAGYQACDIIGAVDLGNYQAMCPAELIFSPAMGGCIFSSDDVATGGSEMPELVRHELTYLYIGNTGGEDANCRAGASTDFEIVTELPEGTPVAVDAYQGNWSRLAFEDGTSCFVSGEYLTDVQPVNEVELIAQTELPTEIDVPVDNLSETDDIGDGSVTTLPNTGTGPLMQIEAQEPPAITPTQEKAAWAIVAFCAIVLLIVKPYSKGRK